MVWTVKFRANSNDIGGKVLMYFQIYKLILWPKSEQKPRILKFELNKVNVVTGSSKTGKSAVIPIIDYCLGSEKCSIPVGVIRENCSWFGIEIDTLEGRKLLARREPGEHQTSTAMFWQDGPEIEIPNQIKKENDNLNGVKAKLDRLAMLPSLDTDTEAGGYNARASFRDLSAFTFQPQNIIANPDVLFYKTDTTEHREKLRTVFPYVLQAVTPEILSARAELQELLKNQRRLSNELKAMQDESKNWRREAKIWIRQAIELGILAADSNIPDDWGQLLQTLKSLVNKKNINQITPDQDGLNEIIQQLETLRSREKELTTKQFELRQRQIELNRLLEAAETYGDGIVVQRERLAIADWFRDIQISVTDPLVKLAETDEKKIETLCNTLDGIELQLSSQPALSENLDRELLDVKIKTENVIEELTNIRQELALLEKSSDEVQNLNDQYEQASRFIGRLEQALQLYHRSESDSELTQKVSDLEQQINNLRSKIDESQIQKRLDEALDKVAFFANKMIGGLDAEWPDAYIRLNIKELTVQVQRGQRKDFLWEIGSGANWLAYHIVISLALQRFFLDCQHHPVPAFLIYDQPSQVYFPRSYETTEDDEELFLKDEDIKAVRKVFALLDKAVGIYNGKLQVIVLDHADEKVWGGLSNTVLTEEWRGKKLVPVEWYEDSI